MAVPGISWSGVFVRIVLAIALVLATYNPSGYSFYHWMMAPPPGVTAMKALLGVVLLIGWVICLRTAFVALGWLGVALGVALLAALDRPGRSPVAPRARSENARARRAFRGGQWTVSRSWRTPAA
jgi:hypothetical protein